MRLGLILLALIGLFFALSASPFERFALIEYLFAGPFVFLGALAAFSAVLTFQDARQPSERALRVPPRAIAGIAISLSGALLAAAMLLVSGMHFTSGYRTLMAAYTVEPSPMELMHFDVHFGGGIQYSGELI